MTTFLPNWKCDRFIADRLQTAFVHVAVSNKKRVFFQFLIVTAGALSRGAYPLLIGSPFAIARQVKKKGKKRIADK